MDTLAFQFWSPTLTRLSMTMWLPVMCQSMSSSISIVISLALMRACMGTRRIAGECVVSGEHTSQVPQCRACLRGILATLAYMPSIARAVQVRRPTANVQALIERLVLTVALSSMGGCTPSESSRKVICDSATRKMGLFASEVDSFSKSVSNCDCARLLAMVDRKPGHICVRSWLSHPACVWTRCCSRWV
jgi:hypothetical protein